MKNLTPILLLASPAFATTYEWTIPQGPESYISFNSAGRLQAVGDSILTLDTTGDSTLEMTVVAHGSPNEQQPWLLPLPDPDVTLHIKGNPGLNDSNFNPSTGAFHPSFIGVTDFSLAWGNGEVWSRIDVPYFWWGPDMPTIIGGLAGFVSSGPGNDPEMDVNMTAARFDGPINTSPVPEPTSLLLMLFGISGGACRAFAHRREG